MVMVDLILFFLRIFDMGGLKILQKKEEKLKNIN